jgi:glucosamine-phosphate N-acetyltransferase
MKGKVMHIEHLSFQRMNEYLTVLNDLSPANITPNEKILREAYEHIINQDKIVILVIDIIVIGTASILFEKKLIHGLSTIGHIEDVVVKKGYRNVGIGKSMVSFLLNEASLRSCYKVLLSCNENNTGFYAKHGFKCKEITMRKNL